MRHVKYFEDFQYQNSDLATEFLSGKISEKVYLDIISESLNESFSQHLKGFNNDFRNTLIISAFPGCGKSHYFRENKEKIILDSDSSKFDKSDFPRNYIQHIKENIGKADVIMVSSHKEVRDALVQNGIQFTLVYPDISIKEEYIKRYIDRGNTGAFIDLLDKNWNLWISELDNQIGCKKIKLKQGEYLSDVL